MSDVALAAARVFRGHLVELHADLGSQRPGRNAKNDGLGDDFLIIGEDLAAELQVLAGGVSIDPLNQIEVRSLGPLQLGQVALGQLRTLARRCRRRGTRR